MRIIKDIIKLTKENPWFRTEVVTGDHSQVVLMSIPPGGEIGEEVHQLDQILVIVEGIGDAILDEKSSPIETGYLIFVPAGTKHNF